MEHFFGLVIGLAFFAGAIVVVLLSIYTCKALYDKYRRRYPKKISYEASITDRVKNALLAFVLVGSIGWYAYLIGYGILKAFA